MKSCIICYLAIGVLAGCGIQKKKNDASNENHTDESGSDVESVGQQIPPSSSPQTGATILMADGTLPECNDKNQGQTFYVMAESQFRYCDYSGAWTVINLKGPKGDTGNTGLPSTPGSIWAMYSGTTRMGKTFKNPLDIGLTAELDTEAFFTQLEPGTYMSARLSFLSSYGTATSMSCLYHKTNDCSGPCYSPQAPILATDMPAPKIVAARILFGSPNPPLYVFDFGQIGTETFNSAKSQINGQCINLSTPENLNAVAGYPYTLPNGVSYPLTNINFKAE